MPITSTFRGAILSVPHGQIEAARAMGIPPVLLARRITLPLMLAVTLGAAAATGATLTASGLPPVRALRESLPNAEFILVGALATSWYMRNQLLRDTDWASMAHSLEVRTPLADATLLDRIARLGPPDPSRPAKHELVTAPRLPVPPDVATRRKSGFAVPVAAWIKPRDGHSAGGPISGYG